MRDRLVRAGKALLFLFLVQLILSAYRWLPGGRIALLFLPVVETFALAFLATVAGLPRWRRVARGALSLGYAILLLYAVGEAFYQYIYLESFVPWTDLAYFPALLNMVFDTNLFESVAVMAVVYVVAVSAVGLPVFLGVRAVGEAFADRPVAGSAAILAVGILAVVGTFVDETPVLGARLVAQARPPLLSFEATSQPAASSAEKPGAVPVLDGSDLHLIIVESYGHTLFTRADHAEAIAPSFRRAESELSEAGYSAYSHFLRSPAFGGRSWLADATLLTGLFIDSQAKYNELIHTNVENLTHVLGDAGFHRIFAAPGTYEADDEWRTFYEYDHYLFRYDFGYEGPFISFGAMPDQYLLHRTKLFADERDDGRPFFFTYILVTSHVPFERIPPYVEEWNSLGDGSVFGEISMLEFENNWLTGAEYPEGYIASIDYVLETVTAYIAERLNDDSLVVVVGDHQPRIPIAEPEASFSVPIHVISKDPEKVRPFRHYGFQAGFTPMSRDHHPSMDAFLPMLLSVLDGSAEVSFRWDRNVPR